jgi:1,4-alpha-glucan branching enzyme
MLFMGQEMLEPTPWTDDVRGNVLSWDRLAAGDKVCDDFLRFVRELLGIRRDQPALRGEPINVHHVHNSNRVIAYHRWLEGVGRDVVVVASLNEFHQFGYRLGMPQPGRWTETFNSGAYYNWVNPDVVGNGGSVWADGPPFHGMPCSATMTIPANAVLVLVKS